MEDWENYLKERIDEYIPNLNKAQKQAEIERLALKAKSNPNFGNHPSYIDKMGVFCMTEKKDNILMWSHYADGHRGICLEFHSIHSNPFFAIAYQMEYTSQYSKPNLFRSTENEKMQAILLTKSKDWEYEKEWRIINHDKGPGVYSFPAKLLTGVILGCSMVKEHKDLITALTLSREPKPKIYQAEKRKDGFGLDIIEVNK
ncbi:MAG: DUF2971 domain-containing protein [Candidatus Omnitrophota bacterium]